MNPRLNAGQPIIEENGTMAQAFRQWTQQVDLSTAIVGTGSPEEQVIARQYQLYINATGTTGTLLYVKKLPDIGGDKSKGWVAV